MTKTSGSRRISSAMASRRASRTVMVTIAVPSGTSGSSASVGSGGEGTAGGATTALVSSTRGSDSSTRSRTAGSVIFLAALPSLSAAASSPSARIMAMGVLTATSLVPSGTRILPSVPSSTASTSMVALSVSISAITSPDLTASPSFLSHLERLPFSMVGDNAGIRILTGMISSRASADRVGGAEIGRRVHLGVVQRADALDGLLLRELVLGGVDARDVAGDIGDQHAPGLGIVEGAAQRHMQAALDDGGAQHLDAAQLQGGGRCMQCIKDGWCLVGCHG